MGGRIDVSFYLCFVFNVSSNDSFSVKVTSKYGSGAQFRFFVEATAIPPEGDNVHPHVLSPQESSIILSSPTSAKKRVNAASSLQ